MIPALKLKVKEKKTKEAQRRRKTFVVHKDRESKVFGISNKGMLWIRHRNRIRSAYSHRGSLRPNFIQSLWTSTGHRLCLNPSTFPLSYSLTLDRLRERHCIELSLWSDDDDDDKHNDYLPAFTETTTFPSGHVHIFFFISTYFISTPRLKSPKN